MTVFRSVLEKHSYFRVSLALHFYTLSKNKLAGKQAVPVAGATGCYHCRMFNFGKPKTGGDWIVHIAGAIVAIFLVWWMLRMFVL